MGPTVSMRLATYLLQVALILGPAIFFAAATWHYKGKYESELSSHSKLAGQVKQQNDEAEARLVVLTRERDEKQAMLDLQREQQEKKDAAAQTEIERLSDELATRPVRVRIVAAPGGSCSGSPPGEAAGSTQPGAGSEATAYGLLPEPNSRRLGIALKEVETLSAAYNSCRATLLRDYTNTDALGGN